jgi:hypothetical protein
MCGKGVGFRVFEQRGRDRNANGSAICIHVSPPLCTTVIDSQV